MEERTSNRPKRGNHAAIVLAKEGRPVQFCETVEWKSGNTLKECQRRTALTTLNWLSPTYGTTLKTADAISAQPKWQYKVYTFNLIYVFTGGPTWPVSEPIFLYLAHH